MVSENIIRDNLAKDLSILEPGLVLIKTEFKLENLFGASGKVDILARDEFGNFVVIEIKKSNQAARQATHELFKYLSIITRQLGVDNTNLRALLVSTEWHELLVPFSEFQYHSPVHTKGLHINVNNDGYITKVDEINKIPLNRSIKISHVQFIYLYNSKEKRDESIEQVSYALSSVDVTDHFLFSCDYRGSNPHVITPFGIYLVFSSPLHGLTEKQANLIKCKIDWEEGIDQEDENFVAAISNQINRETGEMGSPEDLKRLTHEGWDLKIVLRAGRFKANEKVMTDKDLLVMASAEEGGASFYLCKQTSPNLKQQWTKLMHDLIEVLTGNGQWHELIPNLLDEISENDSNSRVSMKIYNLADIAFTLAKMSIADFRYTPSLEIVSKEAEGTRLIFSILLWSGKKITITPNDFFTSTYGSLFEWITLRAFGDSYELDDQARKSIHLETPIIEVWMPQGKPEEMSLLCFKDSGLVRIPIKEAIVKSENHFLLSSNGSILNYYNFHQEFFKKYRTLLASETIGLV